MTNKIFKSLKKKRIVMSRIEGLDDLIKQIEDVDNMKDDLIKYAMNDTAERFLINARARSPRDTGTLIKSWEITEEGLQEDTTGDTHDYELSVWSNPMIISTNPKTPNCDYYPYRIEYGYTKPNGSFYEGQFMFTYALTIAQQQFFEKMESLMDLLVK